MTNDGLSRRTVLRGGAVAGAAAAAAVTGGSPALAHEDYRDGALRADLVLHNGRIHTMDRRNRIASVIVIRDGRIVYVGTDRRAARGAADGSPRTIDLGGRTVVPGLIDCHNHIVLMGNRPGFHTPLENAYSVADVQKTYRERARHAPAGAFITTIGGFHPNQFREIRLPTLAELDRAVPDHPAYLSIGFFGPSVTNTAGKRFFEAAALPVTVGADGSIAAGAEAGKATLALRRTLTDDDRRRSTLDAMAYAASLGVTTHLDQGAFQATGTPADVSASEDNYAMHLPFLRVYDEQRGIVRLRINYLHRDTDTTVSTLDARLRNAFPFFGNDMVRTGGIGEFIAEAYAGGPVFLEAARRSAKAGWRVEVHSLTGTDFQTQIQAFETVQAEIGIDQLRWVIAHVPQISPEYLSRLQAVGGGVNLTGWQYLAGTGPQSGPPFRTIVDHGIQVGIHGDGVHIAPLNPWLHIYFATTGVNSFGAPVNGSEQITREEALRLFTRENSWFLRMEEKIGSIEPGKLADLAVLDRDYFTVPDAQIKQIRSVLTVVDGRIVHNALGV